MDADLRELECAYYTSPNATTLGALARGRDRAGDPSLRTLLVEARRLVRREYRYERLCLKRDQSEDDHWYVLIDYYNDLNFSQPTRVARCTRWVPDLDHLIVAWREQVPKGTVAPALLRIIDEASDSWTDRRRASKKERDRRRTARERAARTLRVNLPGARRGRRQSTPRPMDTGALRPSIPTPPNWVRQDPPCQHCGHAWSDHRDSGPRTFRCSVFLDGDEVCPCHGRRDGNRLFVESSERVRQSQEERRAASIAARTDAEIDVLLDQFGLPHGRIRRRRRRST